ncbi:MAG: CapA family protein [Pseudolabrys sp.]
MAFLHIARFFPPAAPAAFGKPGIATLRVTAEAECRGPHEPARVRTAPDADDLRMLLADVEALREKVDVVVLSLHWGVTWVPRVIADYQVIVGHACIDAGADLILGHHAHLPKAIEIYKGKAIFYSLSNFCMTKAFPAKRTGLSQPGRMAPCATIPIWIQTTHSCPTARRRNAVSS